VLRSWIGSRMMSEPSYNGASTIVVGSRRFDVHVRLTRDTVEHKVERLDKRGGTIEGRVSWGGVIDGLSEEDLRTLQAFGTFELRLVNNGRRGQGVLTDASGHLQGVGEAPF
jgi:hypothetical protein